MVCEESIETKGTSVEQLKLQISNALENLTKERTELKDRMNVDHVDRNKIRIKVDSYNKMHLKCMKLCNKLIVKLDNEFTKNEVTKKQLGLIILLPFVIGIAFYRLNPIGTDSHSEKSNMEIYKEKMQSLQNEFPSQNNRLWKVVRVAMQEHHDKKDNLQPAVLMLASNADANPTMQCLASKLADIYSHNCSQPKFVVPENEFKHLSPESAKVLLDNKISSKFQAGSCASVVRHFELIPPAATKVFYQFCENDNAPYKNVAVILTLQVEPGDWSKPYPNLDNLLPKFWDRVVDDFLTHTLATGDPVVMTTDMIGALLSRITPSVVWVGRENDLNC